MQQSRYAFPVSMTRVLKIALADYEKTLRRWYGANYADKLSREESAKLDRLRRNVTERQRFVRAQYAAQIAA